MLFQWHCISGFQFCRENLSPYYMSHLSLSSPEETQKHHFDHQHSLEWILENISSYFMDSKLTPRDIPVFCCVIWLHHTHPNCISLPTMLESKMEQGKNKLWSKVYTGIIHSLILGSPSLHLLCAKTTSLFRHGITDAAHCHQVYTVNLSPWKCGFVISSLSGPKFYMLMASSVKS